MSRITSNYNASTKDDLFAEIGSRINEGSPNFASITSESLKPDLVAALQLDDEHKQSKVSDAPEFKSGGAAVEIPKVTVSPVADASCPSPPADENFTALATRVSDGMKFAVAFHEPDTYNNTVTCKNSALFWQGTNADFRNQFDKA
jgi:hypothetical protein